MKFFAFLFMCACMSAAVEISAGTLLEIRLSNPVSTVASRVGDQVGAILIAPVELDNHTVIPAGALLAGVVAAVAAPTETTGASLKLDFTQLGTLRISARVFDIDNSRETVDEHGVIQGISPKNTITGRMDQGLGKLTNGRLAGLAQILETAKSLLLKNADPNIEYAAGTEMALRLLKPITLKQGAPPSAPPPSSDNGHLTDLVLNQAFQTYAAHPPRPSDITNLMFIGELDQIREAFQEAGWVGAESLSGLSKWETARAVLEQRGYKEAPVSIILLDERPPDLVLQKTNNTFSARHHLRIWRSPDTYRGRPVWLCGATHDIGIDYSDRDMTFIHKIDSNIDLERRKVTNDLLLTGKVHGVSLIARPMVPTNFRNGTGDDVNTDGRIAVLQF